MDFTIHSQHFDVTPPLRRFAAENLHDPLAGIWGRGGAHLEVYLRDLRGAKGGLDQECRCTFTMPNGPKLVITEVTEDMRKSIHQARKRLMRRTRAYLGHKIRGRRPDKYGIPRDTDPSLLDRLPRSDEVRGARETAR